MFKKWLQINEDNKDLARAYSRTLANVPQDPIHHPEGSVLRHSKLVRRAIPGAVRELQKLQQTPQFSHILGNIDFNISPQEEQILVLTAWAHDIGKSTATTIGGQPWQTSGATGKIQAIGHESPQHYKPQLEKLRNIAPPETLRLYQQNQELIDFLIEHHMDFTSGLGFSKSFVAEYFENDRVKNVPQMKLLLILMWADKMGHNPGPIIAKAISQNAQNLTASSEKSKLRQQRMLNQSKPFEGSPEEFAAMLKQRLSGNQLTQALRNKFPDLDNDRLNNMLR